MKINHISTLSNICSKSHTCFLQIVVLFLVLFNTACKDEMDTIDIQNKKITITIGQESYNDFSNRIINGNSIESDPFLIQKAFIDSEQLHIQVSYSGGCEEHTFELLWPENTPQIYPFQLVVYLMHNAQGDMCEAALNETLIIDLKGNDLNYDSNTIDQLEIIIVNGYDASNQMSTNE